MGRPDDRKRRVEGGLHEQPMAHAEGQQILDRDRAIGRDRVVERTVDVPEGPAVGQLGQQPVDRLVQGHRAVLHQQHRRRGEDRLGHRRDAKDGVAPHGLVAAERHRADRVDVHLVTLGHEGHHPRHLTSRDASSHRLMQALEPGLRKGCLHHSLLRVPYSSRRPGRMRMAQALHSRTSGVFVQPFAERIGRGLSRA